MSKKWIVWRVVATLLLVGLLIAGGVAAYRAGWSQGYGAGQATAGGEEGATLPYPSPGWGRIGRPLAFMPFLFGAGLLFKLALGLVFLVVEAGLGSKVGMQEVHTVNVKLTPRLKGTSNTTGRTIYLSD